jgi:threonyl-tRNA synthetase
MDQINVTLPDGSKKAVDRGTTIADFVKAQIGAGLAKAAFAAVVDGKTVDLSRPLESDASLKVITNKDPASLEMIRHSAAHVVASAVQKLFPDAQVTIGPVIEDGFYYDFQREKPFTPEDLEKIEAEALRIIKENVPFKRSEMPVEEAIAFFNKKGEKFKAEIIEDLRDRQGAKVVSLYQHGDWIDLCRGPHLPATGKIGALKLTSVAGAYWRGDPRNPMLQRIYGTAWHTQKDLDDYLHRIEEAKRRDHRRLGKELELFMFHPWSPGAAFWLPKGMTLYNTLSHHMRRMLLAEGYVEVRTPLVFNRALWETSGHWEKYQENLFLIESEGVEFSLKPMNCPSHMLVFGSRRRSYRELPLRLHDQGVLHRNEPSGTLGGLTRVRQFSQDDAHIFLPEDGIADEVGRLLKLVDRVYGAFGMPCETFLSTRPAKFLGEVATWDRAEAALRSALDGNGRKYTINAGDGAFYGPKIDFQVVDSLGRKWQTATIQLDFQQPQRFKLTYIGADNAEHTPVVIHRAIYGSFERFIATLIEHFAGAFPPWLAPVQATLVTVADRHLPYAHEVAQRLYAAGFRVEVDERGEKLGSKIRDVEMQKIPFCVVIGDKEVAEGGVSPRRHGGEDLKFMKLDAFLAFLAKEAAPPFGA